MGINERSKASIWALLALGCVFGLGAAEVAEARPSSRRPLRIAVVQDGPTLGRSGFQAAIRTEIEAVLPPAPGVEFVDRAQFSGGWTVEGVERALDAAYAEPRIDLVLVTGLIGSQRVGQRASFPRPTLASTVIDPAFQGIPATEAGTSGVQNFSYVSFPEVFRSDVRLFRRLVPYRHLAVLVTEGLLSAAPAISSYSKATLDELGVQSMAIEVDSEGGLLSEIPDSVDAVYVTPLDRLSSDAVKALADRLADRRLPTFTMEGPRTADLGFLATTTDGVAPLRLARRVALSTESMITGTPAEGIKTVVGRNTRLVLNRAVSRAIGFDIPFALMSEAKIIHPILEESDAVISIRSAATGALRANLDLNARESSVQAGQQEVNQVKSALFPQLGTSVSATLIDRDQARAGFGNNPQSRVSVAGTLSQNLYADDVYTALKLSRYGQEAREYQWESLRLDTLLQASNAYIEVLRTLTQERIERSNVEVSRENLKLAEVRRSIGVSDRSEVYRLESQLAQNRARVIQAIANRNNAQIDLNRVMNRELEAPFSVDPDEYKTPVEEIVPLPLKGALRTPRAFRHLRAVMSQLGIEASPDLKALNTAILSARRSIQNAHRAWFLPDFGVEGSLTHRAYQGGAGAEVSSIPGITVPDESQWNLSAVARYPLFEGGARIADRSRAVIELRQRKQEWAALAQRVEQDIRTSLHRAGASFANIQLQQESADAAQKNLEVIQDSYGQGTLSYLNLIDAQDAAVQAHLRAADARFGFLADLMTVFRATSTFICFESPAQQAEIFLKLTQERPSISP